MDSVCTCVDGGVLLAASVGTRGGSGRRWEPAGRARCLGVVEATVRPVPTFEEFYETARPALLRAVGFTIDDRDLTIDVVDEALSRAYAKWPSVAQMSNPSGWAYRVAMNVARNRFRRLRLERHRPLPVDLAPDDVQGWSDPAIAAALARLTSDQRSGVVLRFHLDWSVDAVAEALGVAPGTVKSRLHRALERLESLLEES